MKRRRLVIVIGILFLAMGVSAYFWQQRIPKEAPADAVAYGGKLYKIYFVDIPWDQAKRRCERLGGQLAICPDQSTQDFLHKLKGGKRVWLGATDELIEGDWRWVDGSAVTFAGWSPRQPLNLNGKEHYMELGPKGQFNDVALEGPSKKYPIQGFICEWPDPASASPAAP